MRAGGRDGREVLESLLERRRRRRKRGITKKRIIAVDGSSAVVVVVVAKERKTRSRIQTPPRLPPSLPVTCATGLGSSCAQRMDRISSWSKAWQSIASFANSGGGEMMMMMRRRRRRRKRKKQKMRLEEVVAAGREQKSGEGKGV